MTVGENSGQGRTIGMVQKGIWQGDFTGLGDLVGAAAGERGDVGLGALWTIVKMNPGKGWVSVSERVPKRASRYLFSFHET